VLSLVLVWFLNFQLALRKLSKGAFMWVTRRDENGTDIFRPYSRPNSFRGVQICPYPSPNIQHPIPYPYPNT